MRGMRLLSLSPRPPSALDKCVFSLSLPGAEATVVSLSAFCALRSSGLYGGSELVHHQSGLAIVSGPLITPR